MTAEEWEESTFAGPMLEELCGHVSPRKLRLFACACCRTPRVAPVTPSQTRPAGTHRLIGVAELFAEGAATVEELRAATADYAARSGDGGPWRHTRWMQAARAVRALGLEDAWEAAYQTVREANNLFGPEAAHLLREIVANPFRPIHIAAAWRTPTVLGLATVIAAGAWESVPILGDALLDAGCTDENVLGHCRSERPHRQGCWLIDTLLDRG